MSQQPTVVSGSIGIAVGITVVAALITGLCLLCDR